MAETREAPAGEKLPAGAVGIQDLRWRDLNIEI